MAKRRSVVALGRAIVAYAKIVRDPNKLGEVFSLADSLTEPVVMERIARGFRRHASGVRALAARKRVRVNLAELERLPEGTLGRAYAKFMRDNGLVPEALPNLDAVDEGAFIRAHLYETHDMWHAVTGFDSDVAGELGLQAFYAAQVDGPLPAAILAAGLLNTALFSLDEAEVRMDAIARGWDAGKRASLLFGFDWDGAWGRPLGEVRAELGIDVDGYGRRRAPAPVARVDEARAA